MYIIISLLQRYCPTLRTYTAPRCKYTLLYNKSSVHNIAFFVLIGTKPPNSTNLQHSFKLLHKFPKRFYQIVQEQTFAFAFQFSVFTFQFEKGYFFFAMVLLTPLAVRNPSGVTYSHTALDLLLQVSSKGVLLFCIKKEVPLFTKRYFQHLLNN